METRTSKSRIRKPTPTLLESMYIPEANAPKKMELAIKNAGMSVASIEKALMIKGPVS